MILNTALLCLALNVYQEARGEPVAGQAVVSLVTMNRADWNDKQVCHEVLKPRQFSWTRKLVKKRHVVKRGMPTDEEAWNRALAISRLTLWGLIPDFTGGAQYYHEKNHKPLWRHAMTQVASIGNHIIYKQRISSNEQNLRSSERSALPQLERVFTRIAFGRQQPLADHSGRIDPTSNGRQIARR